MVGKVVEGRCQGNYVHSFSDKKGLYIQMENGEKIAISKTNAISIDDVTAQYPSTARRTIMVLWNDFETSIIQLGMQEQPQPTQVPRRKSMPKSTSPAPQRIESIDDSASTEPQRLINEQPAAKKDVPKNVTESKPKLNWMPIMIASCVPTIILLLVFTICLSTGILQFSSQQNTTVNQPTSNQQVSSQSSAVQSNPAQQAPAFDTYLEYGLLDHKQFSLYWHDGMFKCGVDFQPGEYYILPLHSGGNLYSVGDSPNNMPYVPYTEWKLINKLAFSEGQFVKVEWNALMVPAEQVDTNNWWKYGVYEVGKDIPSGEYKIETANPVFGTELVSGSSAGAYQICENSHESKPILYEQIHQSQMYVTLEDGQYLVIINAKLTPV